MLDWLPGHDEFLDAVAVGGDFAFEVCGIVEIGGEFGRGVTATDFFDQIAYFHVKIVPRREAGIEVADDLPRTRVKVGGRGCFGDAVGDEARKLIVGVAVGKVCGDDAVGFITYAVGDKRMTAMGLLLQQRVPVGGVFARIGADDARELRADLGNYKVNGVTPAGCSDAIRVKKGPWGLRGAHISKRVGARRRVEIEERKAEQRGNRFKAAGLRQEGRGVAWQRAIGIFDQESGEAFGGRRVAVGKVLDELLCVPIIMQVRVVPVHLFQGCPYQAIRGVSFADDAHGCRRCDGIAVTQGE